MISNSKDVKPHSKLGMSQTSECQTSKALVSCIIEQSIIKLGPNTLNLVNDMLFEKYACYVPDCYEYPERLNKVLDDISDSAHFTVTKFVIQQLKEFSYQIPIKKFLEKIDQKLITIN